MGTCPDEIKRLIDHFDLQSDQVHSPDYNETQVRIDFVNPIFKTQQSVRHNEVRDLAGTMLTLNKHAESARLDQEKDCLRREIDSTDRQIDQLVYELYGLTDAEIRIVEASTGSAHGEGTG